MNTKMKQIALPLVVVIAVLLAFSSPAAADYSGDHPLTTYENGLLKNGGLIYETVTDNSTYTNLYSDPDPAAGMFGNMTQEITISIPEGATVKTARLYNYYTWSTSGPYDKYVSGDPAEASLTLINPDGTEVWNEILLNPANPREVNPIYYDSDCVQYWDGKGSEYACGAKYDFPSGTFACDVTNLVKDGGSGIYTAIIENADPTPSENERFVTFGFGLLVVYETCTGPVTVEYWINEGADYIYNTSKWGVYEPVATTTTTFDGEISPLKAELITVVTASNKGNAENWPLSYNMIYFNSNEIGPSTAKDAKSIGVNYFDVLPYLQSSANIACFLDRDLGTGYGECEVVSNAFLVVEPIQISANVTFDKKKLNLNSNGILKAFITLPEGYSVSDIDTNTVMCEGAEAIDCNIIPGKQALEAKFKIQDLQGLAGPDVELTVTGCVASTLFEGSDTVRVIE